MSEIKVNKISPRAACGTVTLGDSGDTFTIPSGATINNQGTALNFGATGAASWNTTVKTGDFTAVAGEGYFVNTTSQAIDVTLPAGTAGAVVAIKDYAKTFDTNAVTLVRNGSDKIGGQALNATLNVEGQAVTLIFIDSTQGWLVTDAGLQSSVTQAQFVTATGGNCILTVCSHKVHIFTGPGTFCVSCAGNCSGSSTVEYLVVAGGGGSGGNGTGGGAIQGGGGGGGGGWRSFTALSGAAPTNGPAALAVPVQAYPITVGAGGSGDPGNSSGGSRGSNSVFSSIISTGGGGGGSKNSASAADGANKTGGSGGGGSGRETPQAIDLGGTGNTPPVSPPQGQPGGQGARRSAAPSGESGSAGGGGASVAGSSNPEQGDDGQPGGTGQFIVGTFFGPTAPSYGQSPAPLAPNGRYFSGGGGGGSANTPGSAGSPGAGGGGSGGNAGSTVNTDGTANTGGGAGGPSSQPSKSGGSGFVAIRYKFQA